MPTWSGILQELKEASTSGVDAPFDTIRRKYLHSLHEHTKRNVLLYATAFTQGKECPPGALAITDEDVQGLMEVVHGLPDDPTDIVLHSPGGSAEVAEGIVEYLHTQYPHIRAIIPQMAMSAATMIACGAHEVIMGKHSCLGPIDPQVFIPSSGRYEPAQAILAQFEMAITQASRPGGEAWAALLGMYGPSLVVECKDLIGLSESLVRDWLTKWMFAGKADAAEKAARVAAYLADRTNFLSHGRHIRRDQAREAGLDVLNLADDAVLQDLALSVFHATTHTFSGTGAVKIIENHLGKAFIKMAGSVMVRVPEEQGLPLAALPADRPPAGKAD